MISYDLVTFEEEIFAGRTENLSVRVIVSSQAAATSMVPFSPGLDTEEHDEKQLGISLNNI